MEQNNDIEKYTNQYKDLLVRKIMCIKNAKHLLLIHSFINGLNPSLNYNGYVMEHGKNETIYKRLHIYKSIVSENDSCILNTVQQLIKFLKAKKNKSKIAICCSMIRSLLSLDLEQMKTVNSFLDGMNQEKFIQKKAIFDMIYTISDEESLKRINNIVQRIYMR